MAIAAEHLYEPCTCTNGMRNGQRCADCMGRGIVTKGTKPTGGTIADPNAAPAQATDAIVDDGTEADDELDNMSINHLRSRAKDLGVSAGGGKDALVARIKAAAKGEPEEAPTADSDDGTESDNDAED